MPFHSFHKKIDIVEHLKSEEINAIATILTHVVHHKQQAARRSAIMEFATISPKEDLNDWYTLEGIRTSAEIGVTLLMKQTLYLQATTAG